jgi:hypothetical protein
MFSAWQHISGRISRTRSLAACKSAAGTKTSTHSLDNLLRSIGSRSTTGLAKLRVQIDDSRERPQQRAICRCEQSGQSLEYGRDMALDVLLRRADDGLPHELIAMQADRHAPQKVR